jgi:hypothetical protein
MKFDLTKSKSMWGFGLAILFYFGRKLLIAQGVVLPEGEWDWIIMFVNGVLICYGVYGFRDAIRKVQVDQYYNDPLKKNIPKNENDNLGKLEQEYQDQQYRDYERITFSDQAIDQDEYKKDKKIIAACTLSGEPTFCLRAQDALAIDTIAHYYEIAKRHECDHEYITEVNEIFKRFIKWRDENKDKMKIPD